MDVASVFAFFLRVIRRHKIVLVGGFCVLMMCVVVLGVPHSVFAAEPVDAAALGQGAIDQLVNLVAQFFNWIATAIGQLILVLIGMILIPILHYDGFSTSYIVGLGWALTRDIVNMFVVIVLLVISVLTIVGSPKANWQQQIPRLFIYVIAVNFSRTICGFLIDIGNIIMFQFVNALVEIGAGNFAQLLKLNAVGDYTSDLTQGVHAWQNLGASWLQVALMTMVLAVIGILVIVMLYRIVFLWVLIILSPAAFFLGGIKDVFSQAGSAYSEWWKKFTSAIILGPILTFFLWLALAVSASGDIVTKENFPVGTTENVSGLVLKAFDISQMTGLLLGLVLLVVGMQQASSAAGAMGGLAAKFVNEGTGASLAKASLKWPSTFGRGAYKTAQTVAPDLTASVTAGALQTAGRLTSAAGVVVSGVPLTGAGMIGRRISKQGNKIYAAGEHVSEEQAKEAREGFKHAPSEYKETMYRSMAEGGSAHEALTATQQRVLREDLATNVKEQKAAAAILIRKAPAKIAGESDAAYARRKDVVMEPGRKQFDKLMTGVIGKTQHDIDAGHSTLDDGGKTAFKATKSNYIDLTLDAYHGDEAKAIEFMEEQDSGFTPSMVRTRALNGKRGARSLNVIRTAMNKRVVRVMNDGRQITALHEAEKGTYGMNVSDAAATGSSLPGVVPYVRPTTYGTEGRDPRNDPANNTRTPGGTPPLPTPTPIPTPPPLPTPTPTPPPPIPPPLPTPPPPLPRPKPRTIPSGGGGTP